MPTADLSGSVMVTLSIKRNGKRCGMAFLRASKSRTVGGIRHLHQIFLGDEPYKVDVVAVPGTHRFDMTFQAHAQKEEVPQKVKRLVTRELIRKAQAFFLVVDAIQA